MTRLLSVDDDRGLFAGLGGVLLTVFVYVLLARYTEWSAGVDLLITGVAAAAVLGPAVALEPDRDVDHPGPPGWLSAMLVAGFALASGVLFSLADVLGADPEELESSTVTWIAALLAISFFFIARRRDSAICLFLAAASTVVAVVAAVDWIFEPEGVKTYRYVLLVLALLLFGAGVALQRRRRRHGVVLAVLSGIVMLGLGSTLAQELVVIFGEGPDGGSPPGWEAALLGFGVGLAALAMITREPGPGYVAAALLTLFGSMQAAGAQEKLVFWPLVLLLLAAAAIAAFFFGPGRRGPRADRGETTHEVSL